MNVTNNQWVTVFFDPKVFERKRLAEKNGLFDWCISLVYSPGSSPFAAHKTCVVEANACCLRKKYPEKILENTPAF